MRFLVRLASPELRRDKLLASVRALARAFGAEGRNPKWTSYGALELDIFSPTRTDFDLFLCVLGPLYDLEFSRDLNEAPPHKSEEDLFSEARGYFNSERYWECHEVLEGVWRLKSGEEKRFLQGIILVCAAFVHHQKGEDTVATSVMRRAVNQLEFPATDYHGLDVGALNRNAKKVLETQKFLNFTI